MVNKYYTNKTADGVYVSNSTMPLYLINENYVYSVAGLNLMFDNGVIIGTISNNTITLNKRNPSALRILRNCGYNVHY